MLVQVQWRQCKNILNNYCGSRKQCEWPVLVRSSYHQMKGMEIHLRKRKFETMEGSYPLHRGVTFKPTKAKLSSRLTAFRCFCTKNLFFPLVANTKIGSRGALPNLPLCRAISNPTYYRPHLFLLFPSVPIHCFGLGATKIIVDLCKTV